MGPRGQSFSEVRFPSCMFPCFPLSALQVRQARMAEMVIAEGQQTDQELAQRGLAVFKQHI